MYSASTADVKDAVLQSFTDPRGHVRIVVATIAFGMGLDAPDMTIHPLGTFRHHPGLCSGNWSM